MALLIIFRNFLCCYLEASKLKVGFEFPDLARTFSTGTRKSESHSVGNLQNLSKL